MNMEQTECCETSA